MFTAPASHSTDKLKILVDALDLINEPAFEHVSTVKLEWKCVDATVFPFLEITFKY